MYTRVIPGLLHITPSLERKGNYTERLPGMVSVSAGGVSTVIEATTADVSNKEAGVSTEISTEEALSGIPATFPPLRVGFVSKFFSEQVRTIIDVTPFALKTQNRLCNVSIRTWLWLCLAAFIYQSIRSISKY